MALACLGAAAPLAAQPAAPAGAAQARELLLEVKGQQPLRLDAAPSRVAIADPQVADVKVLAPGVGRPGGEVLLIGRQAGTTELRVWSRGSRDPQVWTVRVLPQVQAALARRGVGGGAQVDMAGDSGVVTGMAPSAEAHRGAAEAAAAAAGGNDKVVDMSQINTSGVVQVEVKVVELARSVMKDVGINFRADSGPWSGGVSLLPDLASGGMFGMLSYTSRDFSASLALLQNNGMARVLAEPTLLAMSGQSASFLAGGEIPIPVSAGLGTTSVQFKPFGIGLTVTPTVISRERIALKVAPEASELDYANGISSIDSNNRITVIPALRTRKADTMVELGDGETFVISGLVSRQTKASVNKVPLLGDLPIIGAFFRNVQYSQEDRELVIVVTPRLVRPIARGVTLPLPGARQEVSDAGFNAWGYYLLGPMSGQQMPGFSQ